MIRTRRAHAARSLVAAGALALLLGAAGLAAQVKTVVLFDAAAKQTPENLAIDDDGTIYVSLSFASEIRRISPGSRQAALAIPTLGGITTGLAIDHIHRGDLDVAVRSPDPRSAGVWRISRTRFAGPTRIAALPIGSFANGITFDAAGNLYVADSSLGRIWRIARGTSRATVWAQSRLLAPTGGTYKSFPLPGANGIKIRGDLVYVTNTAARMVLTIPILPRGGAGKVTIRFRGIQGDDFAFAANGDMYIAENPLSRLIQIDPRGRIRRVAAAANGLQNPSAVAFDPRSGRRTHLYISNSAYFGSRPSLQEIITNTVGDRLP